ncbi:phosphatidylcholine and lysophosphatidylcholine phospholipase [Tulasnella sp. 403]|nr:phosphatidylcholine and lysophosphatidylcholine phospholipase [Tulasnella sp. 403]
MGYHYGVSLAYSLLPHHSHAEDNAMLAMLSFIQINGLSIIGTALPLLIGAYYLTRSKRRPEWEELREPPLAMLQGAASKQPYGTLVEPPPALDGHPSEVFPAIRIFGFLEKPVLHELTRHLQTRHLKAGETLPLDGDHNFYGVVEGLVQVYAPSVAAPPSSLYQFASEDEDPEPMPGHQLINEVRSGGTLSSLFTILSLLTENLQLSWWEDGGEGSDDSVPDSSDPGLVLPQIGRPGLKRSVSDSNRHQPNGSAKKAVPTLSVPLPPKRKVSFANDTPGGGIGGPLRLGIPVTSPSISVSSSRSDKDGSVVTCPSPDTPPTDDEDVLKPSPMASQRLVSQVAKSGLVARAVRDSTLAVIPAQAFRHLTQKYPKSSAQIVQVILTRFSRVTFNVVHKCLGLTTEVLSTEQAINQQTYNPLPMSFYEGDGILHLRRQFKTGNTPAGQGSDFGISTVSSSIDLPENTGLHHYASYNLLSTAVGRTSSPAVTDRSRSASVVSMDSSAGSPISGRERMLSPGSTAGDLLTSFSPMRPSSSNPYRPKSRLNSPLTTPATPHPVASLPTPLRTAPRLPISLAPLNTLPVISEDSDGEVFEGDDSDDFNLYEEVLLAMARSIGLATPASSEPLSAKLFPTIDPLSSSGMENSIEILSFAAGKTLVRAGEANGGLFYVIDGVLDVLLPTSTTPPTTEGQRKRTDQDGFSNGGSDDENSEGNPPNGQNRSKLLFTVKTGGIAGYLSSLTGTPSYVEIKARTDVYVGFLSRRAMESLIERRPVVLLTLSKRLISLLSPLVLYIDSSLDWQPVPAGRILWKPGEASDSFFMVLNGRLRALCHSDGHVLGEYGQGDLVGELDVIAGWDRTSTLHAIRDSEVARMPQTLFNAISARHPHVAAQLLRVIARRVRDSAQEKSSSRVPTHINATNILNLKTVAIVPSSAKIPVAAFAKRLHKALEDIGASTLYLNQAAIRSHIGRHDFTQLGKLKVSGWLAEQELRHRIVLYVADSSASAPWTQTCIRQADYIMIVGMGDDPNIGEYEEVLMSCKTTARKELVLLHSKRSVTPGTTRQWLKARPWADSFAHVELPGLHRQVLNLDIEPDAASDKPNNVQLRKPGKRPRNLSFQSGLPMEPKENLSDFARLARKLCGQSIGLVLGGGGARGIAHLGVLKALEEFSVPIDYVGGTSMGAHFSETMTNIVEVIRDLTLPIVAYTSGHGFSALVYQSFGKLHIEDMWLSYFCNSTNITLSRMEVHNSGYAWRYIRASMSLASLLPPICDRGNMLVDGAYVDNLPVATMMSMGLNTIITVDVGSTADQTPQRFGDSVSGLWELFNRLNPFSSTPSVPAVAEIQDRIAFVSSIARREEAKSSPCCHFIQPALHGYTTMHFNCFDDIVERGYRTAIETLTKWKEEGKLPNGLEDETKVLQRARPRAPITRRNSV